jgi:hypothetical protein
MIQKSYQLLVVLLFILSAFGWGRLMRRFLDPRVFVFHSLTAIIGIAVLGFIGGLLNLLHLAKTPVLLALMLVGVGIAVREVLQRQPWRRRTFPLESIPLFVAPVFALCAALFLMRTGLFNIGDDFHTYVTRATRMAETGTLAGNAFDSLGLDSLGSASFFHCFFLAAGGVEFLNGFDAVACFALCLFLLAELSLRWRMPWWLGLSAIFAFVWINPQYVNISPLYSGAAGIMALMVCGMFLARTLARNHRVFAWRLSLTAGLLVAWLVTMKITLAFFAAIFLATLFCAVCVATANRRAALKSATVICITILVGVLPWALVAMPSLLKARNTADGLLAAATMADKYPSLAAHESRLLFTPIHLFYGNTPVLYLAITCVALALGLAGLAHWLRCRRGSKLSAMPAVAAAGVTMTAMLFLNGHLFPISTAIRYSCPVLIGGIFIVAFGFLRARTSSGTPTRRWLAAGLAVAALSVLVLFNGTFLRRLDTAMRNRTLLAFRPDTTYASYCRDMLTREQAVYHQELQSKIPDGATALVWTATPFHFDFQRNRLLTMSVPGISSPALRFPAGLPPGALEQYFHNNGVQFVVLEKKGYGVVELSDLAQMQRYPQTIYKKLADFGTYLRLGLDELAARGKIIYSDDRMLIFELGAAKGPQPIAETIAAHRASSP